MSHLEYVLPVILLALIFSLKLFIDQQVTVPIFIESLLALPIDISLLATTFVAAYIISVAQAIDYALFVFIIFIIGSIIIVFLWRRSRRFFEQHHFVSSFILALINYISCLVGLVFSVRLLIGFY
jgi:hypothetical protein